VVKLLWDILYCRSRRYNFHNFITVSKPHIMKMYMGCGGKAPNILDLSTFGNWVISFTSPLFLGPLSKTN